MAGACWPVRDGLREHVTSKTLAGGELTPAYSFCVFPEGLPVDIRPRYVPDWVATGAIASTASDIVSFYHGLFAATSCPVDSLDVMGTECAYHRHHPIKDLSLHAMASAS